MKWFLVMLAILALIVAAGFLWLGRSAEPQSATLNADRLAVYIEAALGPGNREVERVISARYDKSNRVTVEWNINDSLTETTLSDTARYEAYTILQALAHLDQVPQRVTLIGHYVLPDAFGNVNDIDGVVAVYDSATLGRINWDGFVADNIWTIADSVILNPVFAR